LFITEKKQKTLKYKNSFNQVNVHGKRLVLKWKLFKWLLFMSNVPFFSEENI